MGEEEWYRGNKVFDVFVSLNQRGDENVFFVDMILTSIFFLKGVFKNENKKII